MRVLVWFCIVVVTLNRIGNDYCVFKLFSFSSLYFFITNYLDQQRNPFHLLIFSVFVVVKNSNEINGTDEICNHNIAKNTHINFSLFHNEPKRFFKRFCVCVVTFFLNLNYLLSMNYVHLLRDTSIEHC